MADNILEIACFNLGSAIIAESSGAHRIEFCTNYWEGGITPRRENIIETKERIKIPVHVMIRPRGGDYIYSSTEIKEMKDTIAFCRDLNVSGIVIGVLNDNFEVDMDVCADLLSSAGKLSVTFHRAVDHCPDQDKAFDDLVSLGISRVLTSGGKPNALSGLTELKRLNENYGDKITIVAGGGIRSTNLKQVVQTGCREFHSAALTDNTVTTNATEIKKLLKLL